MEFILNFGVIIFSIGVFLALTLGVLAMARGDSFNKNWSQKLMRMRVLFQALVVLFIVVFFGLVKG
mgnify:CR=1 FL=1